MARLTNELPRDLAPTAEGEDTIEERVAVIAGWGGALWCAACVACAHECHHF